MINQKTTITESNSPNRRSLRTLSKIRQPIRIMDRSMISQKCCGRSNRKAKLSTAAEPRVKRNFRFHGQFNSR